jgi:hypothetical protein
MKKQIKIIEIISKEPEGKELALHLISIGVDKTQIKG